jgi:hypothetical protein
MTTSPHPRPPLYFIHIPKTAGTSLIEALDQSFASAEIAAPRRWEEFAAFNFSRISAIRFWRGHFGFGGLDPLLDAAPLRITVLRDPVALARSRYAHIKRDPATRLHRWLNDQSLSFSEFIRAPEAESLLSNPQCRNLSLTLEPAVDREALVAALRGPDPDGWVKKHCVPLAPEAQFQRACHALDALAWVGVTDSLQTGLPALEKALGVTLPPLAHLLQSAHAAPLASLSHADRAHVEGLAWADRKLLDQAQERDKTRVLYCR